jgi:hypothetical protein
VSDYRRVLDWMFGFIAPYTFIQFGTTGDCSAIAILHTFQLTVKHALGFSVFTSCILATDFITVSLTLQVTHDIFFSQPNSFLAIILHSIPSSYPGRLASRNSTLHFWLLFYTANTDHAENTTSIVTDACLLFRCLAMDVLLLRPLAPAGMN